MLFTRYFKVVNLVFHTNMLSEVQEDLKKRINSGRYKKPFGDLKLLTLIMQDDIGSTLIFCVKSELRQEMKALKSSADGKCHFNSMSILKR